jgi:hypothetical protein
MPGIARGDLCHLLRRAFGNNLAALDAAFGAKVDDPVRGYNHVKICLTITVELYVNFCEQRQYST